MNRTDAAERRRLKRMRAQLWTVEEYPALKVLAKLHGVYERVRWNEFESRPLVERWTRRNLLSMWIEELAKEDSPLPFDWLAWRWTAHLKKARNETNHIHCSRRTKQGERR
jgi:hypothetical protein